MFLLLLLSQLVYETCSGMIQTSATFFRVDTIQTVEEFNDVNTHFTLYYSSDIIDLQNLAKANATLDGMDKVFGEPSDITKYI